ncbi:hypothetical protein JZ751_019187 [Albula glossodonta]|uniref:Uncharacterized protein n=1 Tax=Albula glossodonta TaxID=121402 RepID=A0A8T2NQB9_9TELE|nr:hypothetical protein JZ751_019187 [Albula glossodonta]
MEWECESRCCWTVQWAVEELLESLDLEKSNYHMGLSRTCQSQRNPSPCHYMRDTTLQQGKGYGCN